MLQKASWTNLQCGVEPCWTTLRCHIGSHLKYFGQKWEQSNFQEEWERMSELRHDRARPEPRDAIVAEHQPQRNGARRPSAAICSADPPGSPIGRKWGDCMNAITDASIVPWWPQCDNFTASEGDRRSAQADPTTRPHRRKA